MAFLPLPGLFEVELSESRPEFQTARREAATAAKLSSLRSRHIHFVEYLRCALACTAAAKLAFAHALPAPPSMPNWTHFHCCAAILAGHWPVAGIFWAWCSTAAPRFDEIFMVLLYSPRSTSVWKSTIGERLHHSCARAHCKRPELGSGVAWAWFGHAGGRPALESHVFDFRSDKLHFARDCAGKARPVQATTSAYMDVQVRAQVHFLRAARAASSGVLLARPRGRLRRGRLRRRGAAPRAQCVSLSPVILVDRCAARVRVVRRG